MDDNDIHYEVFVISSTVIDGLVQYCSISSALAIGTVMYTIFIMLDRVITGLNCSTVYHIVALSALECVVNHIQHHAIPWPHSSTEVRYEILSKAETVVSVIFSPISKRNVLSGKEPRELSFNVFLIAIKPNAKAKAGERASYLF